MKKNLIVLFLLGLFSCDERPDEACVRVKLINQLCGQANVQILDENYYRYGQSWQDGAGQQYEHIFATLLPCSADELTVGQVFYIQFTDAASDQECVQCKAYLYGPDKFNYIRIPDKCVRTEE